MSTNTTPASPTISSGYTYRGFRYEPGEDYQNDCIKIWHDVVEESTNLCTDLLLHFSPYKTPTEAEFRSAVDACLARRLELEGFVLPKPGNGHLYYWCSITGPKGQEVIGEPMLVRVRPDGMAEWTGLQNAKRTGPLVTHLTADDFKRFSQTEAGAKVLAWRALDPVSQSRHDANQGSNR
jgi:hypothetical protein